MKDADTVVIAEGSWKRLQGDPQYEAKKKADRISYGRDDIINRAHESRHRQYEEVARELARPHRFGRRYLSKAFFDAHVKSHESTQPILRRVLSVDGVIYCFLFSDNSRPREERMAMLETLCFVARGKFQQNWRVIGIATEKEIARECSYDYCLLELREWTEENQKQMEDLQQRTGILTDPQYFIAREDEYPPQR